MALGERLKSAWDAFSKKEPESTASTVIGYGSSRRIDRRPVSRKSEKSIAVAVYTRIAIDVAAIPIRHVRLDDEDRYSYEIDSPLNECFKYRANVDETGTSFIQDAVEALLDDGTIAIVPTEIDESKNDIYSLRIGRITEWYADRVKIDVYNENTGRRVERMFYKNDVAIVYNPFYSVMNEPNSTGQRLIRKLSLLDAIDEQSGSGKLDLIIQLPYSIRSKAREEQAANRKKAIEDQLHDSPYGIAYIDSTEHVTQLNRPVDNNLMKQIEYLQTLLYSQLGITQAILDGSAKEEEMNNYYQRTISPIISAITEAMEIKFLTKTAITQKQAIRAFRDPFKLIPVSALADIVDKFARNEVMSSNEFRQKMGMKPDDNPKSDELINSNIRQPEYQNSAEESSENIDSEYYQEQLNQIDANGKQLDDLANQLGG